MKLFLIIIAIIGLFVLLLLLVCLVKVTIHIRYYHAKDNDDLTMEVHIFRIIKWKKKIPLIKVDDNSPTIVVKEETQQGDQGATNKETKQYTPSELLDTFSNTKMLVEHVINFHRIVRYFLSKVTIQKIEWSTIIGVGDAALTGTLTGAIYAIKGSIMGIISHYTNMKTMPKLIVYPQFQRVASETLFSCMIQFRIGHSIMAGIKLVKYWKGGLPHFKTSEVAPIQK